MTHPLEQLAGFVDGTLGSSERADVDEHLRSCARCRDEVSMATAAREALRAIPVPGAPDLAAGFAPDRVAALTAPTSRPLWNKVAPALAAAAVVALVALVVPRLGTPSGGAAAPTDRAAEAAGAPTGGPLRLEDDDTDYDSATLEEAATEFAATSAVGDSGGAVESGPVGPDATVGSGQSQFAGQETERAFTCLHEAFTGFPGEIVRLKRARFEGTPAFLGFVLESPGAGAPADIASIWVAAVEDCSILSVTSVRL